MMKLKTAKLLVVSLFIIFGWVSLGSPNPFAAKIRKSTRAKKQNTSKPPLLYKGYALTGKGKVAFVQYDGRQYIVQKRDKLQSLQIIDIRDEYIVYKLNNKTCRAAIEVGDK